MVDDVLLSKVAIIKRCLARIREEYLGHDSKLTTDHTRQDSIVLNLQRACEAAIDQAMHTVRLRRLGLPQDARDAFTLPPQRHAGRMPALQRAPLGARASRSRHGERGHPAR